ncbi:MAG: SufS family cysteine desulfurase [Flavobacteriales bacterium]|nr:SufS family cysteine desulfurase [Flavobacteriales bacterium]
MFVTGAQWVLPGLYRDHFPLLHPDKDGKMVHYLDNSATTQKPEILIQATSFFYQNFNANVHRGVYGLAAQATQAYENVRAAVARFIKAPQAQEIIFTSGATESLNMVANWMGQALLKKGDEVIVSMMEHHANLVPWQQQCARSQAKMVAWLPNEKGELDLDRLQSLITKETRVIAVTHVSNVLGTVNPIREICALAHQHNILVVVDGSQAVAHIPVNVEDMDCDFYCFSAHKMFGPTGLGILYGKKDLLNQVTPFRFGGEMVDIVTFEESSFMPLPARLEAGTPNMAGVYGMGATLNFLKSVTYDAIYLAEQKLMHHMFQLLERMEGIKLLGQASERVPVFSLLFEDMHPGDVAQVLDQMNVAVRAGYHCAMPLHRYYQAGNGSLRVSLAFYNNQEDLEALEEGLKKARKLLVR